MTDTENRNFLQRLREKVFQEKQDPTSEESARLIELAQAECNFEAMELLILITWLYRRCPEFEPWTAYYTYARQHCCGYWSEQEVNRLLTLAVQAYPFDEEDRLAYETAIELIRRAPHDWMSVHLFLGAARLFLPESELVRTLYRLVALTPSAELAHDARVTPATQNYTLGTYFEQYWMRFANEKYKREAIHYYQKALDQGLDVHIARVTHNAIARLETAE